MNGNATRARQVGAALLGLVTLGWVLTGQAARPVGSHTVEQGVPTDWTHRHIIFSQPSTPEQAMRAASDPRYWQQWYRDHIVRALPGTDSESRDELPFEPRLPIFERASSAHDWAKDLGNGGTVGAGNFPAKYSFSITTEVCGNKPHPDFVVFGTSLLGSSTQATIVAFDNLWVGCGGVIPKVFWAYNTGSGEKMLTSPVLSQDGTQIAFVQTNPGIEAELVLLKWKASTTETVSAPATPATAATPAAYLTCTAPCIFTIPLKSGTNIPTDDTNSSVFYDYTGDTAWVGDSQNWLHKFHPVFKAAPAEVRSAPWPVQLNPLNPAPLASPAHDLSSGNVFVGDAGGSFYRVNTTTAPGQVISTGQIDHGAGVDGGPIVDVTSQLVYVFASSDGTTNCAGLTPCAAIYQFPTNFAANATGTKVVVGTAGLALTPNPLFDGQFDNTYRNSAAATGTFYVCGNTGGPPTLFQIPVTGGVLGTPVKGPALTTATTGCSPITDVFNPQTTGNREWIFVSAQNHATGNLCAAGGCVMNFLDSVWLPATKFTVGQQVIDTHFQIQVVEKTGTSGAVPPTWSIVAGGTTADGGAGGVTWINQGVHNPSHPAWTASTHFTSGTEIMDSKGNVELATNTGISGSSAPGWATVIGGKTGDNTGVNKIIWLNLGAVATASAAEAGGTSGIIMDAILAGNSEIYYSTLSNQACTDGTGGCAVQVSQPALK